MKTLEQLKIKAKECDTRMPSIKNIAKLLDECGIFYTISENVNIVEHRSKGKRYVNSRHNGKKGYMLMVDDLIMDTSDSYYSSNSWMYARKLLQLIEANK